MIKRTSAIYIFLLITFLFPSCTWERDEGGKNLSGSKIGFSAGFADVVITRAAEDTVTRIFIGLVEKDSLFLLINESECSEVYSTKSNISQGEVPSSFSISAFKDDSTEPYTNTVVSSSDSWRTYSPSLYWPNYYNSIHFFASTPNPGNSLFTPTYSLNGKDHVSKMSFQYTFLPFAQTGDNTSYEQHDLIFATATNKTEDNSAGGVDLKFFHALSSVVFQMGSMGDADVTDAEITLKNVISSGTCTVTDPVSIENIEWSFPETPTRMESMNAPEETEFRMIPQPLSDGNGNKVTFSVKLTIGNKVHNFTDIELGEGTSQWTANKKYVYKIVKSDEVKVDVNANFTESENQPVIKNVKFLNSGFTTSYIRAAAIGYWYVMETVGEGENAKEIESIVSAWEIDDTSEGTVSYINDFNAKWKKGSDGFYYHIAPVAPGYYTSTLFVQYMLNRVEGPVTGARLKVHIVSQAIDSDAENLTTLWPELQADGSQIQ